MLWSIKFSERIYTWLVDVKPINYKISDMQIWIFIDEWILIHKLNAKTYVKILYSGEATVSTPIIGSQKVSSYHIYNSIFWIIQICTNHYEMIIMVCTICTNYYEIIETASFRNRKGGIRMCRCVCQRQCTFNTTLN